MAESEYTSYYKPGSGFAIGGAIDGGDVGIDFNGNENKLREAEREAIQLLETET